MGAKNHQPCNQFIRNSTQLSRYVSIAYAELEYANVCLEDLILTELDGHTTTVKKINHHLSASSGALERAVDSSMLLRKQMHTEGFIDLPTLRKINLESIGVALWEKGVVNRDSWNRLSTMVLRGGFYTVLDYFDFQLKKLIHETKQLIEKFSLLEKPAQEGELHLVLEENRAGNIKVAFATLYTSWSEFHRDFLASSIISTEVWYAFRRYGSLCCSAAAQIRAA